jgi:hypothetical protein
MRLVKARYRSVSDREHSSVEERLAYTERVVGSNPSASTTLTKPNGAGRILIRFD